MASSAKNTRRSRQHTPTTHSVLPTESYQKEHNTVRACSPPQPLTTTARCKGHIRLQKTQQAAARGRAGSHRVPGRHVNMLPKETHILTQQGLPSAAAATAAAVTGIQSYSRCCMAVAKSPMQQQAAATSAPKPWGHFFCPGRAPPTEQPVDAADAALVTHITTKCNKDPRRGWCGGHRCEKPRSNQVDAHA